MSQPLYFGCWGGVGHYLRTPDGHSSNALPLLLQGRHIDTGFCPPCARHAKMYLCGDTCQPQGQALVTNVEWNGALLTVLSFWDRTVDRRGGSHSTFVLPGVLTFDGAVAAARAAFPAIWARLDAAGVRVHLP